MDLAATAYLLVDFHWQNTRISWRCLRGVDALISGVICKGYESLLIRLHPVHGASWFGGSAALCCSLPWDLSISSARYVIGPKKLLRYVWLYSDLSAWYCMSLLCCHSEEFYHLFGFLRTFDRRVAQLPMQFHPNSTYSVIAYSNDIFYPGLTAIHRSLQAKVELGHFRRK